MIAPEKKSARRRSMKRAFWICAALGFALLLHPQELRHVTGVTNVEVPVRVFDGDRFVDNLTIDDFEVFEDGVPQKIAGVYLIKKTAVLRREATESLTPNTHRTFYLFFELYDYIPRIQEALTLFVRDVLRPDDDLAVVTPMRTYKLRGERLARLSVGQVADQLNGLVRQDIMAGNMEYRHALDDLKSTARLITGALGTGGPGGGMARLDSIDFGAMGELDELLEQYRAYLARIEDMRRVDESKIIGLAKLLKAVEGQKYVFLFYQREFIPLLDKKQFALVFDMLEWHTQLTMNDLFNYRLRKVTINTDLIKKTYSDSSIAVHFLFLTPRPESLPGVTYEEHSEDIFAPFLEIAKATGGLAESSANPVFAMEKAGEASENYYLLYYVPANYTADGRFKKIKVTVKGQSYRVANRSGYFAN
jgi:hypothetical protein